MKSRSIRFFLIGLILLFAILGCELPTAGTPTPFVFPTPNMTMTALFKPTSLIPVTITPVPQKPADTNTVSPAPPSPTLPLSTATATQLAATSTSTLQPSTATATKIPPTATTAGIRSGASTTALYLSKPPEIDGDWGEWKTDQLRIPYVVYGKSNWTNDDDLSAAYRIGWDASYLYLAIKVNDDHYVQDSKGENIYKGDSLELLLDAVILQDFFNPQLSSDDYQLGVSPGNPSVGEKMEAYLWFPVAKAGAPSGIKMAAVAIPGGYRVEAAIPWKQFGITPEDGKHFGFAVSVSDNDQGGKAVQETMISSAPQRDLTDPTSWGDLVLKK